jgi:oligoendopeptidase F
MRVYREKTDRDLRESAWRKTAERCLEDSKKLDNIFDKMLVLRGKIASNAGFDNYRDYKFMQYHRFDYTPADCRQYHDAVEKTVVPVLTEIYDDRKKQMKLDSLRPWDLDVDPQGREPLKPFDNIDEYIKGTRQVFANIRPQFAKQFQEMAELGLLDLESRKGKAPGGYQETLAEIRKPFIFGNVVGLDNDLRLIFHEGGHAFHALASADEPVYTYRHAPIEFCEVASQAMELFAVEHLKVFYNEQDAKRSIRKHFEEILMLLSWIATIDAFQHWIYENPNHTANERCEKWLQIHNRFGSKLIDFSGLETERKYLWHRQLHIFEVPFYYIEYGISLLGALGLWLQSKKDMNGALDNYLKALSLGGSRPLPELFAAAGLEFDFSQRTIAPLVNAVREQLNQLQ